MSDSRLSSIRSIEGDISGMKPKRGVTFGDARNALRAVGAFAVHGTFFPEIGLVLESSLEKSGRWGYSRGGDIVILPAGTQEIWYIARENEETNAWTYLLEKHLRQVMCSEKRRKGADPKMIGFPAWSVEARQLSMRACNPDSNPLPIEEYFNGHSEVSLTTTQSLQEPSKVLQLGPGQDEAPALEAEVVKEQVAEEATGGQQEASLEPGQSLLATVGANGASTTNGVHH